MSLIVYIRNIFGVPFVAPDHIDRVTKICDDVLVYKPNLVFFEEFFLPSDLSLLKKMSDTYMIFHHKHDMLDLGGGLVALVHKDLLCEVEYVPYKHSGLLTDLSIADRFARKGFQVIKIKDSQKQIIFIHTHLTCPYGAIHKPAMRQLLEEQLLQISHHIKDMQGCICICGDLNLEPESLLLQSFIKDNGLVDNSIDIKKTFLGNFYVPKWLFKNSSKSKKLDYFLSRGFHKDAYPRVETVTDAKFKSDHKALLTSIL